MSDSESPNYLAIPAEGIDEVFRNGEVCLEDTIKLALAADQRGTPMAGIFGAGSVWSAPGILDRF